MKKFQYLLFILLIYLTQSYASTQPNEIANTATPQQILESGQNTNQTTTATAEVSRISESAKALKLAESKEWKDLLHIDSLRVKLSRLTFFLPHCHIKTNTKALLKVSLKRLSKHFINL